MNLEKILTWTLALASIEVAGNYLIYRHANDVLFDHEQEYGRESAVELAHNIVEERDILEYPFSFGKKIAAKNYINNHELPNPKEKSI
ncbi:hypothetical protein J4455_03165 [Candidatus Woesearchaeota archaeon]|nr:hypothetical protein [Candidatus Woesearchaeota archaeon]